MPPRLPSRPRFSGIKHILAQLGRFLPLMLFLAGPARAAELPAYFSAALVGFTAGAPPGWAYALAVARGSETSVESFDPGRPPGGQWTLVKHNGHPPTADESEQYRRYRETNNTAAAARATFGRGDLDFGSAQIVREDATRATIRCRFRADAAEPLLAHLELFLTITKGQPAVERTTLRLLRPYSPIFGMTMEELEVAMTFSRPAEDHPSLPLSSVSHFRGRILWLWSTEEDTRVRCSDYRRVVPSADPAEHH